MRDSISLDRSNLDGLLEAFILMGERCSNATFPKYQVPPQFV